VESHLEGADQVKWTHIGDQEHNNIRAALDWGLCDGTSLQDGLRLVSSISLFWVARSYFREGFEWSSKYLRRATQAENQLFKAKILFKGWRHGEL
jgi:predicted ATPase